MKESAPKAKAEMNRRRGLDGGDGARGAEAAFGSKLEASDSAIIFSNARASARRGGFHVDVRNWVRSRECEHRHRGRGREQARRRHHPGEAYSTNPSVYRTGELVSSVDQLPWPPYTTLQVRRYFSILEPILSSMRHPEADAK